MSKNKIYFMNKAEYVKYEMWRHHPWINPYDWFTMSWPHHQQVERDWQGIWCLNDNENKWYSWSFAVEIGVNYPWNMWLTSSFKYFNGLSVLLYPILTPLPPINTCWLTPTRKIKTWTAVDNRILSVKFMSYYNNRGFFFKNKE